MEEPHANVNILDRHLWKRFWDIAKLYWNSEERWKARGLLALVLLILVGLNLTGLALMYLSGDFMTALQTKNLPEFRLILLKLLGASLAFAPVGVLFSYLASKLSVDWELWLTSYFLQKYFKNRAYYHINNDAAIDNPDQRICDSVAAFTSIGIGFISILFFSITAFLTYAGALWNISGTLCLLVLLYAVIGTYVSMRFGKRLINLNFQELQKGADFRYGLVQIRDNAESIAFYRGESREYTQVKGRLQALITVLRMLVGWERNIAFFTTGFNNFAVFLPYLLLAPQYFSGKVQYGVLVVATGAFTQVLSSIAIIVNYFTIFGTFATEITRLEAFDAALDQAAGGQKINGQGTIESREDSRMALDKVTLQTPDYQHTLLREATAEVLPGRGMLIAGVSGTGKSSLLRALAGLWNAGEGLIFRPPLPEMLFLPQRPYMILGSLREQLVYPNLEQDASDDELNTVLKKVNLDGLPERFGGFDVVMDWGHLLSPGEQQRLAFARLLMTKPRYAILDEATSALDVNNEARLYRQLQESGMTYVSVGHRPSLLAYHDNVLELQGKGGWRFVTAAEFQMTAAS